MSWNLQKLHGPPILLQHLLYSFTGCVFFAATVLTTIGYGNFVPRTDGARVVLCILTIPGVALFGFAMAQISELLTSGSVALVNSLKIHRSIIDMELEDWYHLMLNMPSTRRGFHTKDEVPLCIRRGVDSRVR